MDNFTQTIKLRSDMPAVCRLGLASRGNTHLPAGSVRWAIEQGVDYLNWCGHADGLSLAVRELSDHQRAKIIVAIQFSAIRADEAEHELNRVLGELQTDYVDVLTFYYVETTEQWWQITAKGGALETVIKAREVGKIRLVGITTHQRSLAAELAISDLVDLLMIRYNAAHRGAETKIFPATRLRRMPVIAFTCLRWGALLESTPDDFPGFVPPPAREWYRFVLAHPDVAVALMAPDSHEQLAENLTLLRDWRPPTRAEMEMMRAHGDRVYRHAVAFP